MSVRRHSGTSFLMEMQEFASFSKAEQRYIRRSLDVGLGRGDAVRRWSRTDAEAAGIRAQQRTYQWLKEIRTLIPDAPSIDAVGPLMSLLAGLSAFDLAQGRLLCFGSYRFLYERLLGAAVRPWLPAAFGAAALLPHLDPDRRLLMLPTLGDAAGTPNWSRSEPAFLPEWVEKVDAILSA